MDDDSWQASKVLQLVHVDICGPMNTPSVTSLGIFCYLLTILVAKCGCISLNKNQRCLACFSSLRP